MPRPLMSAATVLAMLLVTAIGSLAAADEPQLEKDAERYFVTRDDCGGDDRMRLDTRAGGFEGGCALVVSPANEALALLGSELVESYPQSDGESYLIDVEEQLTGQITTFGFVGQGSSAGVATIDVTVRASFGPFNETVLVEETFENVVLAADEATLDFAVDIDDSLAGEELRGFTVDVTIRGVHGLVTLDTGGSSFITIPFLKPAEA